jgi:hypothetical protein
MTRDGAHTGRHDGDLELLAGLWEEALFARLPVDAPAELKDLVEDIEDPRRVYAVHRASRRHDFQQLLQKFIVQVRDGCGASYCTTSTCFTCRRRIAGKAPVRRYNGTSARTLAAYLASQDNAENGLCPSLRSPKSTPPALESLVFTYPRSSSELPKHEARFPGSPNVVSRPSSPKGRRNSVTIRTLQMRSPESLVSQTADSKQPSSSRARRTAKDAAPVEISEKPVNKDYRSFAANVFETTAFKMMEWLMPQAVQKLAWQAGSIPEEVVANGKTHRATVPQQSDSEASSRPSVSPLSSSHTETSESLQTTPPPSFEASSITPSFPPKPEQSLVSGQTERSLSTSSAPVPRQHRSSLGSDERNMDRRSKPRPSSATQVTRRISREALHSEPIADSSVADRPLSRSTSYKVARTSKKSMIPRPISQLANAGVFDQVALERMPPQLKSIKAQPRLLHVEVDDSMEEQRKEHSASAQISAEQIASAPAQQTIEPAAANEAANQQARDYLPQALKRLDAHLMNFVCDVLQEDGTAEKHLLSPSVISGSGIHSTPVEHSLRRVNTARRGRGPLNLRLEWRLFVEQSIFFVMSDSAHLIESFTKHGQLYDSQTLWYCMLRLARVAPSIVFHSLWLVAAELFAPPQSLQALRSPTGRLFAKHERSLSNVEAGHLLSICFHALVAAVPLVADAQQLHDMSRLRSNGLALSGSGAISRQSPELCLQYDDAFGNDLILRLARRLFSAITTRRYFDDMNASHGNQAGSSTKNSILIPLFSQLDFLNMDAAYILHFSLSERTLHETRMPTVLLDWARQVMLHGWDGKPEVPGDGPFGGALALIDSIHQKRQTLLLGDAEFRCDYFADRLDSVGMPVAWLTHSSTRQRKHLLDFAYMFSPSTLVSYFRAINFSRMSRSYEEASSARSRMPELRHLSVVSMPISPSRVVENPAYVSILRDMLKTASAKYLVLDVRRDNVIKDVFDQLWRREERELTRPLKVHLGEEGGEEGFDSGGVQQEFFRLAVAEALNPDFGIFTVDDRTRMAWFSPGSLEPDWKYELVGLLVSLALFNSLTLPITFPKALYRKLLGEPVTELHHIADGWPDLASGLTTLLEWDEKDGAVEDIFARTYEYSISAFDQPISRIMKSEPAEDEAVDYLADSDWPQLSKIHQGSTDAARLAQENPSDAPLVTHANRNAYVTDYIRYLTTVSIAPQYEAFARGFRACLHPKSLQLLTSSLLQSLVEGVQDIDIPDLQRHARYVGWDSGHRTVRHFWDIVRKYDDGMKRKLLEFVTASDRVPVGGMKNLQFVVQKNGEEEGEQGHLPTAYTCYGTLLLPEYKNKEVLRERLAMALENAQGFGFA